MKKRPRENSMRSKSALITIAILRRANSIFFGGLLAYFIFGDRFNIGIAKEDLEQIERIAITVGIIIFILWLAMIAAPAIQVLMNRKQSKTELKNSTAKSRRKKNKGDAEDEYANRSFGFSDADEKMLNPIYSILPTNIHYVDDSNYPDHWHDDH